MGHRAQGPGRLAPEAGRGQSLRCGKDPFLTCTHSQPCLSPPCLSSEGGTCDLEPQHWAGRVTEHKVKTDEYR